MEKQHKNVLIEYMDAQTLIDEHNEIKALLGQINDRLKPVPVVEYITREEVAKLYNVSLVTINNWKKLGIIQAYNIGNQVRYIKGDVLSAPTPIKVNNKSKYK